MSRPKSLVVVLGTGTEIGKTWVSARLLEYWRAARHSVAARKPAQSYAEGDQTDADVLARASGEQATDVCPPDRSYGVPLAPPMAARTLGLAPLTLADLVGALDWPPDTAIGLVESAGGLRSPQAEDGDGLDLCQALQPDHIVLVADAGLGTINAVRLAVDALRSRGLQPVVILNRFDADADLHGQNLQWLRERDDVDVTTSTPVELEGLADRLADPA